MDALNAREAVDEFHARSVLIEDLTTRELVDELKERLARRGQIISKPKTYQCPYCGSKYPTAAQVRKSHSLFTRRFSDCVLQFFY